MLSTACTNYTVWNQQFSARGLSGTSYLFIPAMQLAYGMPLIVGVTTRNGNSAADYFLTVTSSDYTTYLSSGKGAGWPPLSPPARPHICHVMRFLSV